MLESPRLNAHSGIIILVDFHDEQASNRTQQSNDNLQLHLYFGSSLHCQNVLSKKLEKKY